ncbi:hypothetical protein AVDCRST_MAG81-207 [uncultured Synechococcales cyanobacterium]|uniref:vWA-MoxR associated protein N-terminal HTH domain-containing protein n=1 Tax=uncultured Synechococcales cyanobacterium TaxID=1936017 RepID=A0A6J4URH9_9CYAN|nr:hypothetical protein AVDCRST_MAG81-207 [uncultured Synechococcales cyanobacterium]
MTFEEALQWVDKQVFAKTGRHLSEAEQVILHAAWEDIDYEAAAANSGYGSDHLHRNVGRLLWATLRAVLATGERITKKRFRSVVERAIAEEAQALAHHGGRRVADDFPHAITVAGCPDANGNKFACLLGRITCWSTGRHR